jgi:hypothetical protein
MIIILFSFKDHIKIKLNKKSIYNGKAKRVIEINNIEKQKRFLNIFIYGVFI